MASDGPSLETYVETRFNLLGEKLKEMDLRQQQRFEAQEISIAKADAATEKRLEAVNEFRQVLTDQANTFMSRTEVNQALRSLSDKIASLENRVNIHDGQQSGTSQATQDRRSNIGQWVAIGVAVIAALALIVRWVK